MRNILATSSVVILIASGVLRSAHLPAAQTQAVNPEVLQLKQAADLVVKDLGFTALGEVVLTLHNRGDVAVNPATTLARGARGTASTAPRIKIDVSVNGALLESVYQPTLAGKESKVFTIKLVSNTPKCGESRDLRVVVDQANVIPELHDDNNTTTASVARPCPDLAVHSIERSYSGLLKETYTPEVTIINKGNAPSPPTQVWGTALSSVPGVTGWPEFGPSHNIPALAPGQKTSFKIGGSVSSLDNSWVRIILDRFSKIDEMDETNNFIDKKI